jgi:hypothetical protein
MSVATLHRRLDRATALPGECDCDGRPAVTVVRGDRESRRPGVPCSKCGRVGEVRIIVRRDRQFFGSRSPVGTTDPDSFPEAES